VDGQREDVVQYRVKFLEQMAEIGMFMPIFSGANMEVDALAVEPGPNRILRMMYWM